MSKLLNIILLSVFTISTYAKEVTIKIPAKEVTIKVPEMLIEEKINLNFDGSLTITNPQVYVNGDYYFIYSHPHYGPSIHSGVCKLYGKSRPRAMKHTEVERKDDQIYVRVDKDGNFDRFYSQSKDTAYHYYLEEIICL